MASDSVICSRHYKLGGAIRMERRGAVVGSVVGALVALAFALVISVIPAYVFLETSWRAVVYVAVAVAAPPTVWFLRVVARATSSDSAEVIAWGAIGAMMFDGLMIGFAPALYGQTGDALAWAASSLLFAFASLLVAIRVMAGAPRRTSVEQPA
jgi:hypothetical protein